MQYKFVFLGGGLDLGHVTNVEISSLRDWVVEV